MEFLGDPPSWAIVEKKIEEFKQKANEAFDLGKIWEEVEKSRYRPAIRVLAVAGILQSWFRPIPVLEVPSMPHGPLRNPRKEQFWRDVMTRWRDSGLTVRAYCRRQRLSEASFYAWRQELAQRDEQAQPAADAAAVTFVPLTVQAAACGPAELPVEVVLANGRRLRVPVGVAPAVVRDLLAVLEETPC